MKLKVLYERTVFVSLDKENQGVHKLFILFQIVEIIKILRHVGTHAIFLSTSLIWFILNYENIFFRNFVCPMQQTIVFLLRSKHL